MKRRRSLGNGARGGKHLGTCRRGTGHYSSKGGGFLMSAELIYPEFEVVRNDSRCTVCRVCEKQCANHVHRFDQQRGIMVSDEAKCVNCQRCVSFCPERALKIVKSDCTLRETPIGLITQFEKFTNRQKAAVFFFLLWELQSHCLCIGIKFC